MGTKQFKLLNSLLLTISLIAAPFSRTLAANTTIDFVNKIPVVLRDYTLNVPQVIEPGSAISLDPQFLMEVFGTMTPDQDQIQSLLLNPEEVTKGRVVTQSFRDVVDGVYRNDYFLPVQVKTKSGHLRAGKMAFHAYNRSGTLQIKRSDGADPRLHQSPLTTARVQALVEQNNTKTEAGITVDERTCAQCRTTRDAKAQPLSDIAKSIQQNVDGSTNNLWARYQDFAREFTKKNPKITKAGAGHMKRLYVKSLIEKFGIKDAGLIMAALTGYAESPYRSSNEAMVAEVAAVLKVIENRARVNLRSNSRTLRDIGISEKADARLSNILADWQFSVWNDRDNNLAGILNFNPDKADPTTKRKMSMAFEAQRMMNENKIEFIGKMNDPKLYNYHANYVSPSWASPSRRVTPIIKVGGVSVDLSRQSGPRHIFYAGVI